MADKKTTPTPQAGVTRLKAWPKSVKPAKDAKPKPGEA